VSGGSGSLEPVLVAEFIKTWALGSDKDIQEKHPTWPRAQWCCQPEFQHVRYRGLVLGALGAFCESALERCDLRAKVDILVKPSRQVVLTTAVPAKSLILVPEAMNVKVQTREAGSCQVLGFDRSGQLEVRVERDGEAVSPEAFYLVPASSDKALAPLWFVQGAAEGKAANMAWAWFDQHVLMGMDSSDGAPLPPRPTKRQRQKSPAIAAASQLVEDVLDFNILFPCLVNTVALSSGTVLTCPRLQPAARERKVQPITVSRLMAKAAV
jgi:hypothetical protein